MGRLVYLSFELSCKQEVMMRGRVLLALLGWVLIVQVAGLSMRASWAGVNDTFGVGAKAGALGQAFTAYADDFSAAHYNPAGLVQMEGLNASAGLHVINIDYEQTVTQKDFTFGNDPESGKSSENEDGVLFAPHGGISYRPAGARWSIGYAAYAPFGVHVWFDDDDSNNRYDGAEVYNDRIIYAAPTAAYQIFDNLSLGVSLGMGYSDEGGKVRLRIPGIESRPPASMLGLPQGTGYALELATLDFDLDDEFSLSANVGLLWEIRDWITLGITYRSESKSHMTGTSTFDYTPTARAAIKQLTDMDVPAEEEFHTHCDFRHPQSVSAGLKVDVTSKWRMMFDLVWTDWSVRKKETWAYDEDPIFLQLTALLGSGEPTDRIITARKWNDTFEPHFGTEYQALDWLALRFGYHYRPSSIDQDQWDNNWPIIDYHVFSFGSGIKYRTFTIDLAYSLAWGDDWKVDHDESENLTQNQVVYSPYFGDEIDAETDIHNFMITVSCRF
ncbi:OmpP1/FadL family transporter [Desulfoglaeba alkanexedens]|uniref:Transporter n=1 Tax=Desulfoglaeba alkanexedens ALDC TaxID=980445 RepID=A0A4P8L372_9BACT|nr:outer membrane protein transport protein [Desulfoglaeba alkanexedens]QCQ22308.1 hypothetical protein FDQ92_09125 [Desulfoglaeba alkanexedens ALDC]